MKFHLPDFDKSRFSKVAINGRLRYATASGVSYVDENHVLVVSFLERKLYLIDCVTEQIVDTTYNPGYGDTLDYKDGLATVINLPCLEDKDGSITLFEVDEKEIIFKKKILLPEYMSHGGCILNKSNMIFTNTFNSKRGIYWLNLESEEIYKQFNGFQFYPKDVCVWGDYLLLTVSDTPPGVPIVPNPISMLYLFDSQLKILDVAAFAGMSDEVCFNGTVGFVSLQNLDTLQQFKIEDNRIIKDGVLSIFNFPHGVAVNDKFVAVTNYGDNSVEVIAI